MNTAFDELLMEVIKNTKISQIAKDMADTLGYAVKHRHRFSPDKPLLCIREDHSYFDIFYKMDMIDWKKSPILDLQDASARLNSGPYLFFLNEKAVEYHRRLAEEGYYGFDH